jgi:NADH:ubiquinone oxidoreductase subunit E
MENQCNCTNNAIDDSGIKVLDIINRHKEVDGGLIPVLHGVQELYGYLPEEALRLVSEGLEIPMTEIYGVASFYHYFSLVPKGEHIIRVCLGTACYVKGSQLIINRLTQELGINVGETTKDNKFTIEATRCLGACGLAPVMTVDNNVYGKVTLDDVRRILDEYLIREV